MMKGNKEHRRQWIQQVYKELPQCVIATFLISFGVTMFIGCELGSDTVTVLLDGVNRSFHIPVSLVDQALSILFFILAWVLNRKQLGMSSVINTLFLGICLELSNQIFTPIALAEQAMSIRIISIVFAQCCIAIGYAWLQTLSSGMGVIDALLYGISYKTHIHYVVLHILFDALCITTGSALHGVVGVGTIFSMLTMGAMISMFQKSFLKLKDYRKIKLVKKRRKLL